MNNLKILITKLSDHARLCLEKSANTCIHQQNYEIEIEHFFLELLSHNQLNDVQLLLKNYKLSKYCLYSVHVVAAIVRNSPRASAGLSKFAASF
jgi:type VI secretion system protein VasG